VEVSGHLPEFATVCRLLRVVLGFAQEDLAAHLYVSRKSVQRWERALAVPDDRAEELLAELCRQRRVFEHASAELEAAGVVAWGSIAASLVRARGARSLLPARRAVPVEGTALVGRDDDLRALSDLITRARLLTVVGPGGVGKTTLVQALIAAMPATVFVPLAEVAQAELVLDAIAGHMAGPVDAHGSARAAVVAGLGGVPVLVLDNLEHLPGAHPLVADLVASCPSLTVVATSRRPLNVAGEAVYTLRPLPVDGVNAAASQLFAGCAARSGVPVDLSIPVVGNQVSELCRRLDGLPLAIELAAHRLRAVSLADLVARLDRPLAVVAGGGATQPERHRSLRACVAWSVDLLSGSQAALLGSLAPFVAGWSLSTAEELAGAAGFEDLVGLVDAGLVWHREGRYGMSEAVREFAAESSAAAPSAMVGWAIRRAASISDALRGPEAPVALGELDRELANFRAALGWALQHGEAVAAQQLCGALAGCWDARSLLREARRWLEQGVALEADAFLTATLRTWLGYFAALQGDFEAARRHAGTSLGFWEQEAVDAGVGYACLVLGRVAAETGAFDQAATLLERSEAALRAAGDEWGLVRPINAQGELARERGDLREAQRLHTEAMHLCRRLGDDGSLPSILADLANVAADGGEARQATSWAEEALAIATARANPVGVATALDALGRAQLLAGRPRDAMDIWDEADSIRAEIHHPVERRDLLALETDRARARDLVT
jgi:predicted ATPase